MAKPVVGWSEITGKDGPALQRFYSKLSGWSTSDAGDGSGYGLAGAGGKGIADGIGASQDGAEGRITFYAEAGDPAAFLDRAGKLGGKTVGPPAQIPGSGLTFAFFADPGGHIAGLSGGTVQ
jgi:predicted enzyme related to lactoylglutathione lyase